ncbi:MAG: TonB-dependent receptor [Gammaproteobacteria bacterium]|nr:TonB-dependent receptor [Gammaproteobacteria bacterium]
MSTRNHLKQAVHVALACGMATSLIAGPAALAADQNQNSENTAQLGKIEVTGTKIKRASVEQAQPIEIISRQQIKATGLATIGEILQKLTSTGGALNTLANDGGNFTFTGGGQTNVDLRNLGSARALVLVNGKRWVTGLNGTVDLNTIPSSIIDHIEILQDGASAIYGSDAIAGVVNIITIKNFTGTQANAYMGIYNGDSHWDGNTQSYDFTMGTGNDHSNMVFDLSYTNQNGISSANRKISKEPTFGAGLSRGSSATPQGRFVFVPPTNSIPTDPNNAPAVSTGLTSTQCPTTNFGSSSSPNYEPLCDLTLIPGQPGTAANQFAPFVQTDRFNYAPYNYVLTPEERYSGYLAGHTDLADNLVFNADFLYSHRDSRQQAGPTPLFFASTSIVTDGPANQQYNPFGFDLNTNVAIGPGWLGLLGRRMVEAGPRIYTESEDTFRFSGGFTGYFNAGGSEWDWDAGYIFSKDNELDTNFGSFNVQQIRTAMGDPATCAATSGCVPINFFGGQTNPISPAQLAYTLYTQQNHFQNNQRIYNADISNSTLATLPAGPLGFAAGIQYLEHDGFFQPDSVAANGYDSFNPKVAVPRTAGRISEKSVYTEFDIPLLANLPAMKLLDLDVASRHTNYSTFGTNTTSRAGLKWQPYENLLVRGTWSQGFRAPNISELFAGPTLLSSVVADPCSSYTTTGVSATVQQRCANGIGGVSPVPTSYTQSNSQINTLESGNPNLKPETSISRTIGFVYSPDWLAGLNINADYYKIDLENTLQPTGGQNVMNGCYVAGNLADCGRIVRGPSGAVKILNDSVANVGSTLTDGVDIGATYAFSTNSLGDFKAGLNATYIRRYNQSFPNANGGATVTKLAGVERGGTVFPFGVPHWKAKASLNWTYSSWMVEWDVRYISALTESCSDSFDGGPFSLTNLGLCSNPNFTNNGLSTNHLGQTIYHDAQVNYNYDPAKMTFTFGIRNLFDKNPPSSTQQQLNSFDPTLYDVPGRFFYVRVGFKY